MTLPLEKWKEWTRRDDWHQLFVASDIRQMVGEIERLSRELHHQKDLTESYKRMVK